MMKCKSCQREVDLLWNGCPYCGQKLNGTKVINIVTIIWCVYVFCVGCTRSIHNAINMVAIVAFGYFVIIMAKNRGYSFIKALSLVVFEIFGIIVLGKVYTYVIFEKGQSIKSILEVGLSSYGALLGIITALIVYRLLFKVEIKELFYISLIPVPIAYAIGKIGCFVDGCCYGRSYNGLFSITYLNSTIAPKEEKLFPVQLVEAIVFLLIFLYYWFMYKKDKTKDMEKQLLFIIISCAISKFMLDFLRASHNGQVISKNQIISILAVLMVIFLYIISKKGKERV